MSEEKTMCTECGKLFKSDEIVNWAGKNSGICGECWDENYEVIAEVRESKVPWETRNLKLFKDGDQWCVLYGENIVEGIAGFGKMPTLAFIEFSKAWKKHVSGNKEKEKEMGEKKEDSVEYDEILLDNGETLNISSKATRLKQGRKDYNRRIIDVEGLIPEDEPVVLFRANDKHMVAVLGFYADLIGKDGGDNNVEVTCRRQAQDVREWQEENGCKQPDIPDSEMVYKE